MQVYSVGHSNHPWALFAGLIQEVRVDALIDVRSSPYSRISHFSRPALKSNLAAIGIAYFDLGAELGGRPNTGLRHTYEQMATTRRFIEGLDQVVAIARRHSSALLCAEHDPLSCHRALLVGRHLAARGVDLRHILRDGRIETQREFEDRLLVLTRQTEADLFAPRAERLTIAYRSQEVALQRQRRKRR